MQGFLSGTCLICPAKLGASQLIELVEQFPERVAGDDGLAES
jgi:hypothetical protein